MKAREVLAKTRCRFLIVFSAGLIALFTVSLLSIAVGSVRVSPEYVVYAVIGFEQLDAKVRVIIQEIRIPRLIEGVLVGASLSIAGAALQALTRNALADPYVIGVASGAAFGAVCSVILQLPLGIYSIPILAFIGALAALVLTLIIAKLAGGSSLALILSGVAVSITFSALTTLAILIVEQRAYNVLFWLFGSLSTASWRHIPVLLGVSLVCITLLIFLSRELNAIVMGDEYASQLGINIKRLRYEVAVLSSLLTATAVAFVGILGFVGLVVPHMLRISIGGDHRYLLPACVVFGALLLVISDMLARTAIAPAELPLGLITSIIGVPVFIYLLIKAREKYVF